MLSATMVHSYSTLLIPHYCRPFADIATFPKFGKDKMQISIPSLYIQGLADLNSPDRYEQVCCTLCRLSSQD